VAEARFTTLISTAKDSNVTLALVMELPLDQVRTLLTVVDEGTFDAAAAVLHVTPSAVSQRVKALEQRTGSVLVTRTKPVGLTESGQVVVRFARRLAALEQDARAELSGAGEPVRVPIAVNADSLATWFLAALARVPDVCFELHREDQDHTTTLLREGTVMAAVTSSATAVQGCSVRPLGHLRYLPLASPAFASRWLTGSLLEDLARAPVVMFDRRDDLQDRFIRSLGGERASEQRHYVPASDVFVAAVAEGLGWGMVPAEQAAPRLRSGALTALAPPRVVEVPLYWQQWKLDLPALSAVATAVADAAATALHN
jgi:LysR family transcriptional regulator, chromosome initiation inhibitor